MRLARWGRKHRTLVVAAAAVLIVTTTATGLVAWQEASHSSAMQLKNNDLAKANTAIQDKNADLSQANEDIELQRTKAEEREQAAGRVR